MKTKRLCAPFLLWTITTASAQNIENEYLRKVLTNLEKIESAAYYSTEETWQPGDTTALSIHREFTKEYNNPWIRQ